MENNELSKLTDDIGLSSLVKIMVQVHDEVNYLVQIHGVDLYISTWLKRCGITSISLVIIYNFDIITCMKHESLLRVF